MRDALTGRTRTWPYGTAKAVEVVFVEPRVCLCVDSDPSDHREGYILIDGYADEGKAKPGDRGTITFTAGGPTGGHWVYTANAGTEARVPPSPPVTVGGKGDS